MTVLDATVPGYIAPAPGAGMVFVSAPDTDGTVSGVAGLHGRAGGIEYIAVLCTTEAEAVAWALAQPAADWLI